MGEDGTENLDELEDSWARTQAEMDAVESGGTGYYDDALYDPNLTDLDEKKNNQSYDESADFANFGNDEDDYAVTRNNAEDDGGQQSGEYGEETQQSVAVGSDTFEDDYDNAEDKDDNDDNDADDDNDDDLDLEDEGDIGGMVNYPNEAAAKKDMHRFMDGTVVVVAGEGTFRVKRSNGSFSFERTSDDAKPTGKAAEKEEDDKNAAIPWKPGTPITLTLLNLTWDECRKVPKVVPMVNSLNAAILQKLIEETGGSYLMLAYDFLYGFNDPTADLLTAFMALAGSFGQQIKWTFISGGLSLFSQQWRETKAFATFPSVLRGIVADSGVQNILQKIYKIAVPVVNKKYRKKS